MANHGSGSGSDDFEALARQYWSRWGEMLRAGGAPSAGSPGMGGQGGGTFAPGFNGQGFNSFGFPGAPGQAAGTAGMPGWDEAMGWWSQLARGGAPVNDVVDRFNAQARGWYGQMQQLAARFAGEQASAADIADAWKQSLSGAGGNPFAEVLRGMQGPGQQGFERWMEEVSPFLEQLTGDARAWMGMPAFGFTREHQERWQQLARAQQDYQQQSQAYQALMSEAVQDAFKRFERKLEERSEPGRQLESARALFDLWIDAAEEAYADIALSPRFSDVYGAMVNSQMRLRAAVQREVEQAGEAMGVPTRTEVDAAHRKITVLEREVRRLRDLLEQGGDSANTPAAEKAANAKRTGTAAGSKSSSKKSASKKTTRKAASKSTAKKAAGKAGKPAAKATAKKTAKKTSRR